MAIIQFPDPRTASPEGIVAIGGDLHPESVLAAYRRGIFPWPVEKLPLLWFCPAERGVLDFAALHLPRSLRRARRQTALRYTIDRAFGDVIRGCADTPRPGQQGTWITPAVIQAYVRLAHLGIAHSVEAWADDTLVGGLYGVDVRRRFRRGKHVPSASQRLQVGVAPPDRPSAGARPRLDRCPDPDPAHGPARRTAGRTRGISAALGGHTGTAAAAVRCSRSPGGVASPGAGPGWRLSR